MRNGTRHRPLAECSPARQMTPTGEGAEFSSPLVHTRLTSSGGEVRWRFEGLRPAYRVGDELDVDVVLELTERTPFAALNLRYQAIGALLLCAACALADDHFACIASQGTQNLRSTCPTWPTTLRSARVAAGPTSTRTPMILSSSL